ncbi:MAG TPA: OmpA family protein [Bacteroidia bacterium]|nr:OmpA family protein [Bacteroidia bacterium]
MKNKLCFLLVFISFLLSSCALKIVAVHEEFPFFCFQHDCRLRGHGNLKSRKANNKMNPSFRIRNKKRAKNKVEVVNKVGKNMRPVKTKQSKASGLHNDSSKVDSKNVLRRDTVPEKTKLVINDSIHKDSKTTFFINFLPDDFRITLEEEKIKRCLENLTIEEIKTILITGFSDSDGSIEYNKNLSLRRAQEVFNFLRSYGIPASKIIVKGEGELFPQKSNSTAEGKKQNRRVEIVIEQ